MALPFVYCPLALARRPVGRAFKLPDGNGRSLRRGWDSNPCAREGKRFSRPPRYDHFDTSPDIFIAAKAQLYADPFLVSAFSILTKSDWLVNDFLIKKQCYLNILQFPILCKHGIIWRQGTVPCLLFSIAIEGSYLIPSILLTLHQKFGIEFFHTCSCDRRFKFYIIVLAVT